MRASAVLTLLRDCTPPGRTQRGEEAERLPVPEHPRGHIEPPRRFRDPHGLILQVIVRIGALSVLRVRHLPYRRGVAPDRGRQTPRETEDPCPLRQSRSRSPI